MAAKDTAGNKEPAALAGTVRRRPFSLDRDLQGCYTQHITDWDKGKGRHPPVRRCRTGYPEAFPERIGYPEKPLYIYKFGGNPDLC